MDPTVQRVDIWYAGQLVQSLDRPQEAPRLEVRASRERRALLSISYDELELPFALATAQARPGPAQEDENEVCDLTWLSQRVSSGVWPFVHDRCWNNVDHDRLTNTVPMHGHYLFIGKPAYLIIDGL